jgi:phosphoribosylanthranilate isomerase
MCKIKICGVRETETCAVLNELCPDYVGMIVSDGFRRSIGEAQAGKIRNALRREIDTVGVFVNDEIGKIIRFYEQGIISAVQLHGDEDEDYIANLKSRCPLPVIKAVGVNAGMVPSFPENCDFLLLDARALQGGGGTGKRIVWREYTEVDKPIFLAGGLTAENVAEAIRKVKPYAVDTSGGVETDGVKDEKKIEKYIKAIREVI